MMEEIKMESIKAVTSIMMEVAGETPTSRKQDNFRGFELSVIEQFNRYRDQKIFKVNTDPLVNIYLGSMPEDASNHYNCTACKKFITQYGGLAVINSDGSLTSVLWDPEKAPEFFKLAASRMKQFVEKQMVDSEFFTHTKDLGTPESIDGEFVWDHLYVEYLQHRVIHANKEIYDAYQKMAHHIETVKTLKFAMVEYTADDLTKAKSYLHSDKCDGPASHTEIISDFIKLKQTLDGVKNKIYKHNLTHQFISENPVVAHIRGTAVGRMLYDIRANASEYTILKNYADTVDPLKRMVAQTDVSVGNLHRANDIVAKLGMENSFKRRFAKLEDFTYDWAPPVQEEKPEMIQSFGIFGKLLIEKRQPIENAASVAVIENTKPLTFHKFLKDNNLKDAVKIEVLFTSKPQPIAGFTEAVYRDFPGIFKYDNPDNRCTLSPYFYCKVDHNGNNLGPIEISEFGLKQYTWYSVSAVIINPPFNKNDVYMILSNKEEPIHDIVYKQIAEHVGSMISPQLLKSELHEIRKSIEKLSKEDIMENPEDSLLGIIIDEHNGVNLRVTTTDAITTYVIDRVI